MLKLVGTVHVDLNGVYRTKRILDKYRPENITIEWPSNYDIDTAMNVSKMIQNYPEQVSISKIPDFMKQYLIKFYENMYFELKVPLQYMNETDGVEVHFVDTPRNFTLKEKLDFTSMDDKTIQAYERMPNDSMDIIMNTMDEAYFDYERLKKISSPFDAQLDDEYRKILTEPTFIEKREEFMFQQISEIMPDIHFGGIWHVFGFNSAPPNESKPLYKRLIENGIAFEPVRLCDVRNWE